MENDLHLADPPMSDENFAFFQQALWDEQDDVAFSSGLSMELPQRDDYSESDDQPDPGVGVQSVFRSAGNYGADWWARVEVGPTFRAPFVDLHFSAAVFHERIIVLLVICYFSPSLVWLPHGLMKAFIIERFRPILWRSVGCPLFCFGCQLTWYRLIDAFNGLDGLSAEPRVSFRLIVLFGSTGMAFGYLVVFLAY
ncbi:unnamed protein product [Calypogeia fissa]